MKIWLFILLVTLVFLENVNSLRGDKASSLKIRNSRELGETIQRRHRLRSNFANYWLHRHDKYRNKQLHNSRLRSSPFALIILEDLLKSNHFKHHKKSHHKSDSKDKKTNNSKDSKTEKGSKRVSFRTGKLSRFNK